MSCERCTDSVVIDDGVFSFYTGRLCQDCADEVEYDKIDEPMSWLSGRHRTKWFVEGTVKP